MIVKVKLHTIFREYIPNINQNPFEYQLANDADVNLLLDSLGIPREQNTFIVVINGHFAEVNTRLTEGDFIDLVPAISGG